MTTDRFRKMCSWVSVLALLGSLNNIVRAEALDDQYVPVDLSSVIPQLKGVVAPGSEANEM